MNTKYLSSAGTFSKNPEMFGMGKEFYTDGAFRDELTSRIYFSGKENNVAIDWVCGLGANLYGHNHPGILEAIHVQVEKGLNFSIVHQLEYEVAELLATKVGSRVPGWNSNDLQVRFMKTGTESCDAAIRLARAITQKECILTFGYHGTGDSFVAATPPAHGILNKIKQYTQTFEYGDKLSVEKAIIACRGNIAAIIVEHPPITAVNEKEWYQYLRKAADENNALLIIDEVVTGFRWGLGGVCEAYDIHPDLVCYGKALGGGLALSAVMGPTEYMSWFSRNDPVFVSSTQFGETLPLATAKYVLQTWNNETTRFIWEIGNQLINKLKPHYNIYGHGTRSLFKFSNEVDRAFFIHGMLDRGILVNRPNFPNLAHSQDDVDQTVNAAIDVKVFAHEHSPEELKNMMKDKMPRILFKNR